MRYTFLASSFFLIFASFVEARPAHCCCFQGFYGGAAVGVASNHARADVRSGFSNLFSIANASRIDSSRIQEVYDTVPLLDLHLGWGKRCSSCFYFGARLGVTFSSFEMSAMSDTQFNILGGSVFQNILQDTVQISMNTAEGTFDFKPGYILGERTMLFGIVGAAYNQQCLKGFSDVIYSSDALNFRIENRLAVERTRTTVGLRGGFGLEQKINHCMSVSFMYVYTHYNCPVEVSGAVPIQTLFGEIQDGHDGIFKAHVNKQVTSMGCSYYF